MQFDQVEIVGPDAGLLVRVRNPWQRGARGLVMENVGAKVVEAMGLCQEGEGARMITNGECDIGGRCAVSASGGLLAMGHPIGPTGGGQVAEITRQLRGEAGVRQHPDARTGLAHLVGVGAVCVVHVLQKVAA